MIRSVTSIRRVNPRLYRHNQAQLRSDFRHLKADEEDYKRSDSGGLFMLVTKTGSKLWRCAYSFDAKQKLLAIGQ